MTSSYACVRKEQTKQKHIELILNGFLINWVVYNDFHVEQKFSNLIMDFGRNQSKQRNTHTNTQIKLTHKHGKESKYIIRSKYFVQLFFFLSLSIQTLVDWSPYRPQNTYTNTNTHTHTNLKQNQSKKQQWSKYSSESSVY